MGGTRRHHPESPQAPIPTAPENNFGQLRRRAVAKSADASEFLRWSASIRYNGKVHYLGTFDTKQEAALAYDKQARQCGEDKPLNYEWA